MLLAALAFGSTWAPALSAAEIPLHGGRVARVRRSGAGAAASFTFRGDAGLASLGDPRCPARSGLRIGIGVGDYRVAPLACANWRAISDGFAYEDPAGGGGVRRIVLRPDSLEIQLAGPPAAEIPGPVSFLDVALQVGAERACGRFGTFRRNRAQRIIAARGTTPCPPPRPNVLVIDLDDTRADGIDRMPVLLSRLAGEGVRFRNAFVPNALCCPSRASFLTGRYAVNHGTRTLVLPIGGAPFFRRSGGDRQTIATWLRAAGYRAGLFGKYLNSYGGSEATAGPGGAYYVPPGWDRWRAMGGGEHYGGINGATYTLVDERGATTTYADHATDAQYSTDLLAGEIQTFVGETVRAGKNFFVVFNPYASHADTPGLVPKPAQRHLDAFLALPPWRPASYNESDLSDKPLWLQALPSPSPATVLLTDRMRRRAYESLLAVDEQLGLLLDQLEALGVGDDTLVILTSDNGVTWGEHGMFSQGKQSPYEEALRVPLVVRYPRRVSTTPAEVSATVLNIDLPATIADLAGVSAPAIDGAAFTGWLTGAPPPAWRDDFLLEHWAGGRTNGLTWSDQPRDGDRLRLLSGPPLPPRAAQVFEFDAGDGIGPGAIAVPIGPDATTTYANLGAAVQAAVAGTTYGLDPAGQRLVITDTAPGYLMVQWREELDQAGAFAPDYPLGDFFGVRDVANQYTYVEHASGEVELYDLAADPDQLQNRADDPGYLGERLRLAARLRELLP
ncbi:sulfatase-like hydrolase/transferase [bacterium]|nr:sulfatase-like hydrolase/transferase [bacterium]